MSYCRMYLSAKMDRPIIKDKHYLSPGGYEFHFDNNQRVRFDFNESAGIIRGSDPTVVDWELRDFECLNEDAEGLERVLDENEFVDLLLNHRIIHIEEAFVYTGEDEDPEINLERIDGIFFGVYDSNKDKYFDISVPAEVVSAYNRMLLS